MAYKESNPAKLHLIQFTIVISIMILSHLFIVLALLLVLLQVMAESGDYFFESFYMIFSMGPCLSPILIIYIIVVFSLSLVRRGAYGEKHSKSSVIGFFFGILGLFLPPAFMIMAMMFMGVFERVYLVMPFLMYCVPASLVTGMYFFVKDIGGKTKGAIGLIIYLVSATCLVLIFTVILFEDIEWTESLQIIITLFAILFSILNLLGLIMLLLAYIDGFKWTSENRPLMDTEQKQQLEMQQYQITMQRETLDLQREQIDMQMEQLKMLTEVRQEVLEDGRQLIPDQVERNKEEWDYKV